MQPKRAAPPRKLDFRTACSLAGRKREKETSYVFANGRTFKEPFDPTGTGVYRRG